MQGLTLCPIIVFNMIFEWLPNLCTPHIQLSVRSLSRAVNFKHRFNHKDQGGLSITRKDGYIGRWVRKADIEYPFEDGEVINYTLNCVSIHPVTKTIQVSFLTQLPERKETAQGFHHEANGDFKTVTEFNGCNRRKLRMDQQHCTYSTIPVEAHQRRKRRTILLSDFHKNKNGKTFKKLPFFS